MRANLFRGLTGMVAGVAAMAAVVGMTGMAWGEADVSTPRKTLLSLDEAIKAHDIKALRECLTVTDAGQQPALEAYISAWEASLGFQEAMQKKFGQAGAEAVGGAQGATASLETALKAATAGTVRIDGDRATLTIAEGEGSKGMPAGQLAFQKVEGNWKVDAGSLLGLKEKDAERRLGIMKGVTGALKAVTAEINDNKFANAGEAQHALVQRVIPVVKPAASPATQAGTQPATASAPATGPGTQP